MDRRALVTATLLVAALIFAPPTAGAQIKVLLLPDSLGDGTYALVDALEATAEADIEVTVGPVEYAWYGANPSTCGFDVVVHLNGATYESAPPILGQLALVDFVSSGGGYVSSQWNGYEVWDARLLDMDDLVLQLWPGLDHCVGCSMTWTGVSGKEDHPVLKGIPASFPFSADAHNSGPLVDFDPFPSVVLMTSPNGGPAVTVREFKDGRVVAFSSAANFLPSDSVDVLTEPMIQLLYINAVSWAAPEQTAWTIDGLREAVAELKDAGALNKGQANALMSKLDNAARQIERDNLKAAENQMRVFVNKVNALIRSGVLTQEEGETLLAMADEIMVDLVC